MELRQYLGILHRRWRLVVLPAVLAGLVVAALMLTQPTSYQSTTTLFYTPRDNAPAASGPVDQRLQSYVTLLDSPRLATAVIKRLGLTLSPSQVQTSLSASASADSLLLDVTASGGSAVAAQRLSAAAATELIVLARALEPAGTTATGTTAAGTTAAAAAAVQPSLTVAQDATPGVSTQRATAMRTIPLAVVLGLIIGVIAALLRESVDDRVISSRQLRTDENLRILASVPLDPARGSVGAMLHDKQGPWAEAFRRLRTRLLPVSSLSDPLPRTVLVTACLPQSGTTTVIGGIGITLARAGLRVVIVGADLRHPDLGHQLWIGEGPGLTDVLADPTLLDSVLHEWGDGHLNVLPPGSEVSNPGELVGSDAMAKLVATLEGRFDVVLIEAPPVVPFADPVILAGTAGCGAVLVVRHGRTRRRDVQEGVRLLEESGVRIHGAVLTMVPSRVPATGATSRWRQASGGAGAPVDDEDPFALRADDESVDRIDPVDRKDRAEAADTADTR